MSQDLKLNLLPSQAKFQAQRMKMMKLSKKILTIVGIIWLVLGIVVFGLWVGGDWWLDRQKDSYKKAVTSYLSLSDEVVTSQLIKYRAKILGKVLADRFEYSTAFKKVGGLFGEEVKITGFELKDTSLFEIKLETNDREEVDKIEKRIIEINEGKEEGVSKIVISSVNYDVVLGQWFIGVEVYLK